MPVTTPLDLNAVQQDAIDIARQAGTVLLAHFETALKQIVKGSPYDVVTEADQQAEALIVKAITAAYPDHHINGEEGGGAGPRLSRRPIAGM